MKQNKENVLTFIDNIYQGKEDIRRLFRCGYCFYFACILKEAFQRGEICWAAPFGHIVWKDIDDTAYDIEGEYCGEAFYFIPISYLGDLVEEFRHIPEKEYPIATREDLVSIITKYKEDNHLDDGCSEEDYFQYFQCIW